jgi:hypothetical protein
MVSQNGNDVAVAVRSGSVKLTAANTQTAEELTIEHSQLAKINQQGEVAVEPVTAFDPLWDWTFVAQAGFDLENKSLFQFVQWFAEQSGLTVDWQNHESQTKRVRLQGNIKNMQPELAINTVFQSTQFNYEMECCKSTTKKSKIIHCFLTQLNETFQNRQLFAVDIMLLASNCRYQNIESVDRLFC